VEIQAQNDALALMAKDNITIASVSGETTLTADKGITLVSGGSYIKLSQQGIELGTGKNVILRCQSLQKMSTKNLSASSANITHQKLNVALKTTLKKTQWIFSK
jgi:type VI secretion system secreted protein VgrG